MYTDDSSDLHKKFQDECTYDKNVEYQILNFCYNLFLSYTDNRHTEQPLKMCLLDSGDLKTCKTIKIPISKI